MAPGDKYEHLVSAKPSVTFQTPSNKDHSCDETRQPTRRRKPSITALIIIAIALALLLAAVIVIGTTRRQTSSNNPHDQGTDTTPQPGVPSSTPPTEPPGGDQGLSWCENQDEGKCTLGVYQNLDTGQIRAQVFDNTCLSFL